MLHKASQASLVVVADCLCIPPLIVIFRMKNTSRHIIYLAALEGGTAVDFSLIREII